ncbi:MAG: ATP-binding protein, partial [Terriglobales bacterium]
FQYAGGGSVEFRVDDSQDGMLFITFSDRGRGIHIIEEILNGKYVSQTGMGLGIIGAKRLMDYFTVESKPGEGTVIVLGKKLPKRFHRLNRAELDQMLGSIERASQDPYEELKIQNKELLNALQELRARQEELAQLNRELDETNRGVVALYAELNDKADFLQRASELKSHFLSNMSHEFRTPLNSITALSQILLDRLDGSLTIEQEKQVKFIRGAAQDLTELVNDLLDLAKVEAGKITLRPCRFQVASLFAGLRGMLRPLLSQNSSVNLVFEDPVDIPEIYSDEAKISQILRNFISNALKFTERGEVRVAVKRGHDNTVIFSVADTGIGIAADDHEKIFQEWIQLEAKVQKTVQGTGLGLPLTRKFARLLGGDVYVQSELGIGSTFFAALPITFTGATDAIYIPDVKRDLESDKLPVLVVEDNQEALFIYEKYLKNTRFQVMPARTLAEARNALRRFRPAAVILDVLLQGEHSWELLHELKRDPATASIPAFVITVVENREKALAMGADAFHSKPVDRLWLSQQLDEAASIKHGHHVLIIDDDEASRYVLKTVLGQMEFRFSEASGGRDGLRRAQESLPDIIILDLAMPDVTGFEVLKKLKENPRTAQIPVIVHTSKVLETEELEVLGEAVAIVSKESKSRELSLEKFAQAFQKAGIPFKSRSPTEEQHV